MFVRVLRRTGRNKPWIPEEICVLKHQLHGAILAVINESLSDPGRAFLRCPVLAVGRTGVPISNSRTICIQGGIPSDIYSAVVRVPLRILNSCFVTLNGGPRVNEGRAT